MNKPVLASFEISCLLLSTVFLIGLALNIQTAKASGTIYIRADGSVDPPTAPMLTSDNVTYTLTANTNASIIVERNNIIIDGAGYTVKGTGSGTGIDLTGRINVTIKNVEIKAFSRGIYLWGSAGNIISGNNIKANTFSGIYLFRFSYYNTISRNNIKDNRNGFFLVDSRRNSIYENNIKDNDLGIELLSSSGNFIYHNNFVDTNQIHTFNSENVWDDSYPSGGNYWSDYSGNDIYGGPYQNEAGYDWVGDSPYIIDESNQDDYPLMYLFVPEMEEIRIAYRNLLHRYSELLSDFEILNSTLHAVLGNITDLQVRHDSLLSTISDMHEQIDSLNSTCRDLQEQLYSMNSTFQASMDDLQQQIDLLNLMLQTSVDELQEQHDSLNSTLASGRDRIINELNIIRNLMHIFIVTTVILIAATVYVAVRKSQH